MGKSRHVKHYQKYDISDEDEDYHRNDKFKNRRQNRQIKIHAREELENEENDDL